MRLIHRPLLALTAAAAVQFTGGMTAEASSVTLSYEGPGVWGSPALKQTVSYTIDGSGVKTHGAGVFRMKDQDGNSVLTWCIDLFNYVRNNWEYTPGDTFVPVTLPEDSAVTAAITSNMKKLFTAHYEDALASAKNAAAFGMALWEISVDTQADGSGLNLADGRYRAIGDNNGVTAMAASFLSNVPGAGDNGYRLTFFDSIKNQNGVASQNLVTATPVPLPAGVLLLGTGLAGLSILRRRRRES